jgi:hypothetical protein
VEDGVWFGHALRELQGELPRPATPAFVRFTGDAVIDTMRESELGQDRVTDLFWIEMKMPDYAGHRWNMDAPEQSDVLRETDAQVARFKAELDRTVGSGNYILMITADHGQQPLPDTRGGWRINTQELEDDVEDEFGDVVEKVTTTDIFVDRKKISQAGMADVAEWLGGYTIGENIPEARPGTDLVPRGRLNETLFAGAFSTRYLQDLTDDDIKSFGDSDFEEGSYTIDRADG